MKYGVLGTGDVGRAVADKLISLGHDVMMGARSADNPCAVSWAGTRGERAFRGSFADAARFGERIFLCVRGVFATESLRSSGEENFAEKILFDLTNPYLYSAGHISIDPRWSGNTSLGETIQEMLPRTRSVKMLNYVCSALMGTPRKLPEPATGFYCGNDADAKAAADALLRDFGWQDTMDLGDISMARYTEMLGAFWPAVYGALGHMEWAFKLIRTKQ